jgi:hypothetical protein
MCDIVLYIYRSGNFVVSADLNYECSLYILGSACVLLQFVVILSNELMITKGLSACTAVLETFTG